MSKRHEKVNGIIWLAVQVKATPDDDPPYPLEIIGAFRTRKEAIEACQESTDCIGPLTLGEVQPREIVEWEGAFYPLAEQVTG
jgi:hypothetical protein